MNGKAKGTRFETEIARWFQSRDWPAERRALAGVNDKGDLIGIPDWTFELKNRKDMPITQAIDEAAIEARNANTTFYAAILKRRGHAAEKSLVIMELHNFERLLSAF